MKIYSSRKSLIGGSQMCSIKVTNAEKNGWKNVSGSSERSPKCKCGSWKQHWKNFSGREWPSVCSVSGCGNKAVLGAHVYSAGYSNKEFIAPFCSMHNNKDELLSLKNGTVLVIANQSETCS